MFKREITQAKGKIDWVQIDIDAVAKDIGHKIGAEERFMVAMARQ